MIMLLAALLFLTFLLLAILHFYWAAGGEWALEGAMPPEMQDKVMQPGRQTGFRMLTVLVGFGLLAMGLVMVANVLFFLQAWPANTFYLRWVTLAIGGVFALRAIGDFRKVGLFQSGQQGVFAERDKAIYSPLCTGLATGIFLLTYLLS